MFFVANTYILEAEQKKSEPDQKKIGDWPKIPWDWTKFFLVYQKKWEIDWTIGWPRDWPKPHGRDYTQVVQNMLLTY